MRLISLTVRNYRMHRDLTITFDARRNLIGGPNETGKSTLAEAIHRALFFRHRSGGEPQRAMKSDIHGGHPEVKLVFEAAGQTWTLDKRFSGTSGTARLASGEGTTLQGDAAEDRLAQLVGNPEGTSTTLNQLASRWSHLWVWQGNSGNDPAPEAASRRDELIQRLQERGLSAMMQSNLDESTLRRIQTRCAELFTATGAVKAGSKLDIAIKSQRDAASQLAKAEEQARILEQASRELLEAQAIIRDADEKLPAWRENLAGIQSRLVQAGDLHALREKQQIIAGNLKQTRTTLQTADQQIRAFLTEATDAGNAIGPALEHLKLLEEGESAARTAMNEAETAFRAIQQEVQRARQIHRAASAKVSQLEKSAVLDELRIKQAGIRTIESNRATSREELAKLAPVTTQVLNDLRQLESRFGQHQAALDAIATEVELIQSTEPVKIDGAALDTGSPRVITEPAEIVIGGTILRIQPGGGESLNQARAKVAGLAEERSRALAAMAVKSLAEAEDIHARRRVLEEKIRLDDAQLHSLQAGQLPALLESATDSLTASSSEFDRLLAAISEPIDRLPETLAAAREWEQGCYQCLRLAEDNESRLQDDFDAKRKLHGQRLQEAQDKRASLDAEQAKIASLRTSAATLEGIHGDETVRTQAIRSAITDENNAAEALDATNRELQDLHADSLSDERERITGVIANLERERSEAKERRAASSAQLARDGTADPEADLLQARARNAAASESLAREQRHADAIALLAKLFAEGQSSINEALTQPIADRVASYLERLFGSGVRVRVDFADPAKPSIQLTRPGTPGFTFDSLSGGTKEQVASAVRLAMAEIISANHDGCLPLLFDDAFTNSDPARIQTLQSMLYQASTRGLQIIVLSCSPGDYTGLGAKEARLNPPDPSSGPPVPTEAETTGPSSENPPDPPASPPSAETSEAFLTALQAAGGSSGNTSLRESLGWDEATYHSVKQHLIASNRISSGRGRGGSVILQQP